MRDYLKVGSRPRQLALRQVEEIASLLPDLKLEVIPIKTKGDKDKNTPLVFKEGSNFFSYEIEQALLEGEIDLAVHSAKDLEEDVPRELTIALMTKSINSFDCLVSKDNRTLSELAAGSIIGTSSKNRREAILKFRGDLIPKDIRGNIEERLEQLDQGKFDAIVIAQAALIRLGLNWRISQIIPFSIIKPHPLQGRLTVQVRRDREDLLDFFRSAQ